MPQPEDGDASRGRKGRLSSIATVVSCAYLSWAFSVLWRHTDAYTSLILGMGADVSATTLFVMESYVWLYPALFLVVAAVLIAQQYWIEDEATRLSATLVVSLLALFMADWLKTLLLLPILKLVEQLA